MQAALVSGALEERRLRNYRKLLREQAQNAASLAEKRAASRRLGKMYRRATAERKARQDAGS